MSRTREQFPLSPRKITKKTLASTVWGTVALLILYPVLLFYLNTLSSVGINLSDYFSKGMLIIVGIIILHIILMYLYQTWYFNTYFYDLTNDYIVIKKGVITPREITIPYERIQDVYVDQDIFDRIFRLYDVHLSSATVSSGTEAHIDGVEKQAAEGLRAALLNTVTERISKHRENKLSR